MYLIIKFGFLEKNSRIKKPFHGVINKEEITLIPVKLRKLLYWVF